MKYFLEYIKNCFKLFGSEEGYKFIKQKITSRSAILVSSLIILFLNLIYSLLKFGINGFLLNTITSSIGIYILIFVFYGVLHFITELFNGNGSFSDLFKFGFSLILVPFIFMIILKIFNLSILHPNGFISKSLYFVLFVWTLVVQIDILSKLTTLSKFKVILSIFLTLFLIFLLNFINIVLINFLN